MGCGSGADFMWHLDSGTMGDLGRASFRQPGFAEEFRMAIQKRKVFEVARSQKSIFGRRLLKTKGW